MAAQKNRQTAPARAPSIAAPIGPTKPAAGVTATRPATAPDTRPSSEAFHLKIHSTTIQDRPAAAVATKVLIMASARRAGGFQVGAGVEAEPADPEHRSRRRRSA